MTENKTILVQEDMEGERLDVFVAEQLDSLSRSQVKKLIGDGQVRVDGAVRKSSHKVAEGETVVVAIPPERPVLLEAENIPLDIVYQDDDIAVINKPKGLVVHPAYGNWEHTLVNALLYHIKTLSSLNGDLRPGIVHRLDKDTSGLMVVAKHDLAHRVLAGQIKSHTMQREYLAIVHGVITENQGAIEAPVGRSRSDRKKMAVVKEGRLAITHYKVMERFEDYSLLRIRLVTGRTHQIRVHMQYIKHPVAGDPLYTSRKAPGTATSQLLHAFFLGLIHPQNGKYLEFTTAMPSEFHQILSHLNQTQ